jgi:membrane protease YdiL (CAAX protease family)
VGGGILTLLVATVVEVGVVSAFDPDLDSLGARLVTQALLAITLVAIAFAVGTRAGAASAPALGLTPPLRSPIWMAAAAYLGYIVLALVYSSFVHPHQEDVTRDLGFGHGALGAIAAGILIVVAAPLSEEIFFRGFIFGGFRRRLSFPVAAVISAVIFGLFHYTGPGSIGVVPQLAFLGFALAWLYEETGSIYPTIAVHAVNNALAFAILTS